jgi:hypothetical protein
MMKRIRQWLHSEAHADGRPLLLGHALPYCTSPGWEMLMILEPLQMPWLLARKRTIPTDDRHRSANFSANFCGETGVMWSARRFPAAVNLGFLDRCLYYFLQVASQLSSRDWVDSVSDPLLLIKCGSTGNRTRDLWISSQKLRPLDHRGGRPVCLFVYCTSLGWQMVMIVEQLVESMGGRGNRSTRRKTAPVPHDLTRDRTGAAAGGNRKLTAWITARPAEDAKVFNRCGQPRGDCPVSCGSAWY